MRDRKVGGSVMVVFFKSYVVLVCAIAVALPIAYSTVYPMMTGQLAASSLSGLITMFVLFALGMMLGFGIFERRAQAKANAMVALYNDDCDPRAFIEEGAALAQAMAPPYNQVSSWFMGYYGQAKLDVGDTQDAKDVLAAMRSSIASARKPIVKLGILVNAIPLEEKLEGPSRTLELIDEGYEISRSCNGGAAQQYRDFLDSQETVMRARAQGDPAEIAKVDESVWTSSRYPKRIRVEYAWDCASADYRMGDANGEAKALDFVKRNGGSLALADKARKRSVDIP